jgi:hypothetical protein
MRKTTKKFKNLTTDEQFTDIIREQMSDREFWEWVKCWLDGDEICDMAEDWDEDIKKEFVEEWEKGEWEIKHNLPKKDKK